jgi:predicted permease
VFFGIAIALVLAGGLVALALRFAARIDLAAALKTGAPGHAVSRGGTRTRDALIVFGVAATFVLTVGAGVLGKVFVMLSARELGFHPEQVYVARVSRPYTVMTPTERPLSQTFMAALLADVRTRPGITYAAVSTDRPASGNRMMSTVDSSPGARRLRVGVVGVSAQYFEVLRVPLRRGRPFAASDGDAAEPVALVDERFVRTVLGSREPLGRTVLLTDLALSVRVIGVVGNVRQAGVTTEALPQVYIPYDALPLPWVTVVIRSPAPRAGVLATLRGAVARLDPEQPVAAFRPLAQALADTLDRSAFYALLLAAFATASMLLTGVGLYGVVALLVAQRVREFGIRLSLGATPRSVFLLVTRQALRLTVLGLIAGALVGSAATRVLASLLYGASPLDAEVVVGAACLLIAVAVAASLAPARRAATIEPVIALRQ